MKRVRSKLAIAVIAVAALLIVASISAAAFWSVSQNVAGNKLKSGHMVISVTDENLPTVTALDINGLVPVSPPPNPVLDFNKKIYVIESASGNPNTDFAFTIPTVIGNGSLKDNVKVAFALTTAGANPMWLEPNGAIAFTAGETSDGAYAAHAFKMSDYNLKTWSGMSGYTNMAPGALRHLTVYWYLPLDCSSDCHDSDVTFDMSFELLQHH